MVRVTAFGAVECSEGFLNPLEDRKAPTSEEEKKEKGKEDSAARPRCHLPKA